MRVVGGNNSSNMSLRETSAGGNITIASTDQGAVQASQSQLAQAYQNGNAGEQVTLKYAGFAVVALAAVMAFRR